MPSKNLLSILTSSKVPRILVVGDLICDRYEYGETTRINPEAPMPIFDYTRTEYRLGGAGNVAINLKTLGADVEYIGIVGENDEYGGYMVDKLVDAIGENKLKISKIAKYYIPIKTRYISRNQCVFRSDKEIREKIELSSTDRKVLMDKVCISLVNKPDVIILSDYNKGCLGNTEETRKIIEYAKHHKIPIVVDPKVQFDVYRGADFIKPNLTEMERLFHSCNTEDEMEDALFLMREMGFDNIILTMGNRGVIHYNGVDTVKYDPIKIDVADSCGAGDTFISTFSYLLAKGASIEDCLEIANFSGALSCQTVGTYTIHLSTLISKLHNYTTKMHRPITITKYIDRTKKVIFCNGCFDLLHPGHIALLEYAKSFGGQLIVAVNSDEYIKEKKGDKRPYQSMSDRMRILSALSCVDLVTYFDEDTPEQLMSQILPDIYVVGSDHRKDVAGKYAKEIKFFDRIENFSTTKSIL